MFQQTGNSKDFDESAPPNNDIRCGFSDVASESPSVRDSYSEPSTAGSRQKVKSVQKVFENATLAKGGCWVNFEVFARQPEMASYLFMLYKVAQAENSLMKIQEPHGLCSSVLWCYYCNIVCLVQSSFRMEIFETGSGCLHPECRVLGLEGAPAIWWLTRRSTSGQCRRRVGQEHIKIQHKEQLAEVCTKPDS